MHPPHPTARSGLQRWLAAAPLIAVLLASGATGSAASAVPGLVPRPALAPTAWAQEATELVEAELIAGHVGVEHALAFAAADVELDDRAWSGKVLHGRAAVIDHLVRRFGLTLDEVTLQGVHVDERGALVQLRYSAMPGFPGAVDILQVRAYGPDGVESMRNLVSVDTLRSRPGALTATFDAPLAHAAAYAEEAAGTAVASIQGTDAPAVYLDERVPQLAGTMAVVLEPEPGVCPRTTAIQLKVEGGRIREERRLRAPGPGRGCGLPATGWWSALTAPVPEEGPTRSVPLGAHDVELRGASPGLEQVLRWGIGRFRAAGLEPPALASVSFSAATGRCAGVGGRARLGDDGVELLLCFGEEKVCREATCATATLSARITLLHELAHAWLHAHLDEQAEQAYVDRIGVQAWNSGDLPWAERGVERAAETLMWGLLDRHIPLPRIGDPPCEDLSADFRLLTGVAALRDCEVPRSAAGVPRAGDGA
jgi:hypothetical protein